MASKRGGGGEVANPRGDAFAGGGKYFMTWLWGDVQMNGDLGIDGLPI